MVNKKVLLVGLGLITTATLSGCDLFKANVELYGCPVSEEFRENVSESKNNTEEIKDDNTSESLRASECLEFNVELYGCPMSDLTKKNITEAETFSHEDASTTIK